MSKSYYYPRLSSTDLGIFRLGGPGLANCMFFASRAYVQSVLNNGVFINPTWEKFSIGPTIRGEKDKRGYTQLFKAKGITGLKKMGFLLGWKLGLIKPCCCDTLGEYFTDLAPHQALIKNYFESIVQPATLKDLNCSEVDFGSAIAIHVRLGDYVPSLRIPIGWYVDIVKEILKINPEQQFILFSDGNDDELRPLTELGNVKKCFFGNAFADMTAISRCKMLIASDSTFSAWGAFLGRVPIIFSRRHFPSVHGGMVAEIVVGNSTDIPEDFKLIVSKP